MVAKRKIWLRFSLSFTRVIKFS